MPRNRSWIEWDHKILQKYKLHQSKAMLYGSLYLYKYKSEQII